MTVQLTDEDLARIKAKQAQNLTEKLKSGKPLTRPEMAQLEELRSDGVDVPDVEMDYPEYTKSDKLMRETIQRKVGISQRVSYEWLKRLAPHKSNTKGWHVPEMLAMVMERQAAAVTGPNSDLKREELEEKVLILRGKRKQIYGELVDRKDIMQQFGSALDALAGAVRSWQAHNTAKYPQHAEIIDALKEDLDERIQNLRSE
jgi:hypothetical protein